ncbi:Allophanate hydrolase subunit 1 [Vibrio sinaloensis DSM 21326]|uniref:Allophanate hydrolase subunit 1 n=3 Tax=Photobacterium sp. (strain ATCC 43367) TaxID=379097 RepID=E8M5U9_PHOS4|nr:carboxyltransferase domain-containing protein [Vibrio sinaloensis]EGA70671.1 Allophanate hydrolase subunit 1 [Vibrio sinaloensis DSM 21326]
MNVTPSFNTILIDYLPHRVSIFEFIPYLEKIVTESLLHLPEQPQTNTIKLPVYYHVEVGPDLIEYEKQGVSLEDVIKLHSEPEYSVGAIGFTAGFAFLTDVSPSLQLPRKTSPRLKVAKGSVAIANNQTAIYPSESPGGWNIIGNCPLDLYDPTSASVLPFSIGDKIKFESISRSEFEELGGKFDKEWQ